MGSRLRKIRLQRGFTLDQVAVGMGRQGSGIRSYLARLERGEVADPRISTITLFLRACGAQFFEFYDTLTRIEPVLVDTSRIERTRMRREQKEMLLRRVKREVYNFQDETSYPSSGTKQGTVADYVKQNRLNPELVERIRRLVIECCRR